jgi:pimeloyl-ACP methyl ester carboxylesterase
MAEARAGVLDVEHAGRGGARVVFVHGVLDRGRSFDRVAAELGEECQMEWYDRRGYGASVDAPGAPVDVDGHAEDLLAVLGDRPAVVVGHSFGGVTVLASALRAPALFRAIVLYETGMAWVPGWDDRMMRSMLWGDDPEGGALQLMFRERYGRMTPEERTARRREARAFVAEERSVRTAREPLDLAGLRSPLVYGHSGAWQSPVVGYLERTVPGVEVVELPGAGHNAHRSQPGPFADLVRRGLSLAGAV